MVDNCGIISLETIEELIYMREKQLYLEKHENKIWQGKNDEYKRMQIENSIGNLE